MQNNVMVSEYQFVISRSLNQLRRINRQTQFKFELHFGQLKLQTGAFERLGVEALVDREPTVVVMERAPFDQQPRSLDLSGNRDQRSHYHPLSMKKQYNSFN